MVAVQAADGRVIGYTISAPDRAALVELSTALRTISQASYSVDQAGVFKAAACAAALAVFIALTVFPTARAAKLALRLAGLVRKYGATKTARILLRIERGVEYDKVWLELGKALAGVSGLGACVI